MVFVVRRNQPLLARVWKVAGYTTGELGNILSWVLRDHPDQVVVTRQMEKQTKSEDLVSNPGSLSY